MSLPPWHSDERDEQAAFLNWAVEALDEFERHDLKEWMERANGLYSRRLLQEMADAPMFDRIKRDLPHLTWEGFCAARHGPRPGKPAEKPGRKGSEKVAAAKADNANLTSLFKRCYGETTRPGRPSRMAILDARHNLTQDEYATVENYITKVRYRPL